jgi:hypothetical protein
MIDFVVISGRFDEAMTEHAGQLHEHFVDPIRIERGRYQVPARPGFLQAIEYHRWVELLEQILDGVSETDQRKFWRDNAERFYRL